ncbi:putative meiosis arrest female protein [Medicago truncatula]|nr:putative meiosis arrest female protein [Medicago truncatula]
MGIPGMTKLFIEAIVSISEVQLLYIGDDNFCVRLIPSTTSTVKKKKQRDADHSEMPVLFSSDSFGDDVETFVLSSRGSRLISRSRSREDLAHRLQRHGPMFFMSLTENEILQLVELLITKLKWLKESPSEAFPFSLTQSVRLTRSTLLVKELLIDGTWRKNLEIRFSKALFSKPDKLED